jgi:hypothetical protein
VAQRGRRQSGHEGVHRRFVRAAGCWSCRWARACWGAGRAPVGARWVLVVLGSRTGPVGPVLVQMDCWRLALCMWLRWMPNVHAARTTQDRNQDPNQDPKKIAKIANPFVSKFFAVGQDRNGVLTLNLPAAVNKSRMDACYPSAAATKHHSPHVAYANNKYLASVLANEDGCLVPKCT